MKTTTEATEQTMLIKYCELRGYPYNLIFHIPNGGSRNVIEASNLKKQGVKAGVPDLFLPVPNGGFFGLFIEMKSTRKGAKASAAQNEWIKKLTELGYKCVICHGFEEARTCLDSYIRT